MYIAATNGRRIASELEDSQESNPAKGIMIGAALGIVLWAIIIGAAIYAFTVIESF
jgi:hypothetical protein